MIARLTPNLFSTSFPRVAGLMGDRNVAGRIEELEWFGTEFIKQIDRDLEFLARQVPEQDVSAAYRGPLRNPARLRDVFYEIRAAAMFATAASEVMLAPRVGPRKADVMCVIEASRIFVEVTTLVERWPQPSPLDKIEWYERASVERSFDPMPRPDDLTYRDTPASKVLRDRIEEEARQLPDGDPGLVVLGAPHAEEADIEAALFGDGHYVKPERYPNGLFAVSDDAGGVSRVSAFVWLKLVRAWSGVRVHARMFVNPLAAHPLPPGVASVLRKTFDRRAVLLEELERITPLLVEQYHASRIILFGSLGTERCKRGNWIHEWSDIDLAVVACTQAKFSDRIGEVLRLLQPRVGLNVLVYTAEEFQRAEREGGFFVRDEVVARGLQLYP
jgi:predicted nucleotidyltransferase